MKMKKQIKGKTDVESKKSSSSLRLHLLITLLLIFAVEISYSLYKYISIIKRPELVRGIDRKGMDPVNLSVYDDSMLMTNTDKRMVRLVDKITGDIKWEHTGQNLIDAVMDTNGSVFVLSQEPSKITVFSDKIKVKEIFPEREIDASNMDIDSGGNIYIADKKSGTVIKYTSDLKSCGVIGASAGLPEGAMGKVSIAPDDNVFIVVSPGIAAEYNPEQGKIIKKIKIPYLTDGEKAYKFVNIRKAATKDIYVNDYKASRVLVFSEDWKIKGIFYQDSTKKFRFIACGPIDVDSQNVYVNNYIIFVFNLL